MQNRMVRKGLVVGIIGLLILICVPQNGGAEEQGGNSNLALISGRIDNLLEDDVERTFNAVNLRILSLKPLGYYRLNDDEVVYMACIGVDEVFPFFGILTNNFIFGLCWEVDWNS